MSNHLSSLLAAWQQGKDQTGWALGTVYKTEGSAYRKTGAMMLINREGEQFGLLSGGCLETDIIRNAQEVIQTKEPLTLVYDGSDEDDLSFILGIGCGGKVYIMLQAISAEHDLGVTALAKALDQRKSGTYYQEVGGSKAYFKPDEIRDLSASTIEDGWLVTPITPEPHLLVVGGGIDARPVVSMSKELGWTVTLTDPRAANAKAEYFPGADAILKKDADGLADYVQTQNVDAAIIMSHNIDIDADSLKALQGSRLRYIALLGPKHRYFKVLKRAELSEQSLTCPVSGPAGLDIGGQLPESIALSILAECHAVLHCGEKAGFHRMAENECA